MLQFFFEHFQPDINRVCTMIRFNRFFSIIYSLNRCPITVDDEPSDNKGLGTYFHLFSDTHIYTVRKVIKLSQVMFINPVINTAQYISNFAFVVYIWIYKYIIWFVNGFLTSKCPITIVRSVHHLHYAFITTQMNYMRSRVERNTAFFSNTRLLNSKNCVKWKHSRSV